MKLKVLGVTRMKGVSAKSGNDYDMCKLVAMVPVQVRSSAKQTVTGFGFDVAEIELDPEVLPKFANLTFPCELDLETDSRPFMGELKQFVVGIRPPVSAVKSA